MPCVIRILNVSTGVYNGKFDIYFPFEYDIRFLSNKSIKEVLSILDIELKFFFISTFTANLYSTLTILKNNLKFYNNNNKVIILNVPNTLQCI